MVMDGDFIVLDGKRIYANRGILGLNGDGELYYGYDGEVWQAGGFTLKQRREVADYMINLWNAWAEDD